ncbi:MAG: SIS domain-containing protein [Spirochaetota bacterium]
MKRKEIKNYQLKELIELPVSEKKKMGILYTPLEIQSQVELWDDTFKRIKKSEISSFIDIIIAKRDAVLILTGAGTSEFIGYCVEGLFRKNLKVPTNVFSTTKIITIPDQTIIKGRPYLLVSFARSGNSPESTGAIKIANATSELVNHLIITCNSKGELAKLGRKMKNTLLITLSGRTNDRGLAMTSSFSNMVIAAQALSFYQNLEDYYNALERIIKAGKNVLETSPETIKEVCSLNFSRAVFLGDGANYGTAIESHLKLQELTSGKVMCAFDTFMGLRHGPEAVIDNHTLVVAFMSTDPYVRKYEEDLLSELKEKGLGLALMVCTDRKNEKIRGVSDFILEFDPGKSLNLDDDLTPPVYVIAGQLLGLFKSLNLGLKPDSPSETGVIHRVVEGVKIYDPTIFREKGIFKVIAER